MVITIHCPECAASFPVDTAKIPVGGVNARCSSCGHIFRVEKPEEEAPSFDAVAFEAPAFESPPAEAGDFGRDRDAETDFSIGVEAPAAPEPETVSNDDEWVVETQEEIDGAGFDIEPMETVETTVDNAKATFDVSDDTTVNDDMAFFGGGSTRSTMEEASDAAEESAEEQPAVTGFTFGKRDPTEKAKRLARVLVSDMIMYNPERHENALANGTLKEDFEDEIEKSWKEYVEQVGDEMANAHPFWQEALNDVLAKGEQIF